MSGQGSSMHVQPYLLLPIPCFSLSPTPRRPIWHGKPMLANSTTLHNRRGGADILPFQVLERGTQFFHGIACIWKSSRKQWTKFLPLPLAG